MKKFFSLFSLLALAAAGCNPSTSNTASNTAKDLTAPASSHVAATTAEDVAEKPTLVKYVQADAKTATLKAKFVLKGERPKPEPIGAELKQRDPFCAQFDIVSEKMVIGENGEIQNLALFLDERRTKAEIPDVPVENKQLTLDNKDCKFVPHVLAARPGQQILVTNSDQTGHNANFNFFNNDAVNFLIPANGNKQLELKADEPAPIPVDCNIHPWMKAFLIVTEHPYVGISDAKGEMTIENLPVGEVTFRVWHENADGSIGEATVDGKKQEWSRGRMEIELKPGVNDLGTIEIDSSMFQ